MSRERWMALLFAVGSLCFLIGPFPGYVDLVGPGADAVTFFVGSIFFTAASALQFAATPREERADWWACVIQLAGTLFFNVSTGQALAAAIRDPTELGAGWRPDAFGSVAFLISSGLAVVATRDRGSLWDRHARSWHGTWLNMLGSIAFGVSAVGAYVSPRTDDLVSLFWANLGTLIGALCFFVAAMLSRRAIDVDEPTAAAGSAMA